MRRIRRIRVMPQRPDHGYNNPADKSEFMYVVLTFIRCRYVRGVHKLLFENNFIHYFNTISNITRVADTMVTGEKLVGQKKKKKRVGIRKEIISEDF